MRWFVLGYIVGIFFMMGAELARADSMSAGDWRACETRWRMGEITGGDTCMDVTGCYGSNCWGYYDNDIYGNTYEITPPLDVDYDTYLDQRTMTWKTKEEVCKPPLDISEAVKELEREEHSHPITSIEGVLMTTESQPQLDRIEAMLCELGYRTRGFSITACYATDPRLCPEPWPDPFKDCKP